MGDKEFNGDIEEEIEKEWEERISKIENPEKRADLYEQLLDAVGYDKYFANNPHLKCESYLINLRLHFEGHEDGNINDFVDRILRYTEMERTPCPYNQNILIVNGNKKFTFLNTSKLNTGNKLNWEKILEKGKTKLRREYSYREWKEGDDDDEKNFKVVCVKLRKIWRNKDSDDDDDDDEFARDCDRIKAQFF